MSKQGKGKNKSLPDLCAMTLSEAAVSHASQAPLPLLSSVYCLTLSVFLCNSCLCVISSTVSQPDCATMSSFFFHFLLFPTVVLHIFISLDCYLASIMLSSRACLIGDLTEVQYNCCFNLFNSSMNP